MVLNKILDQSYHQTKYNLNKSMGLETMNIQNFNLKFYHFANAGAAANGDAKANAGGSPIALPELCSGQLII